VSLEESLGRFAWGHLPSYLGGAEMVPHAVRALAAAQNVDDAGIGDLYSCVDLVAISAAHDPRLVAAARAALEGIRTAGRPADLAVAIENALEDLGAG
jgi:hypothetical protein